MFLDEWQDNISALHDASAEYNHLRVVCMNHRYSVSRTYIQTMMPDCKGDVIFVSSCREERLKIDLCYPG